MSKLVRELESMAKPLHKVLEKFPWEDLRVYSNWLAQTYYFTSHSTRLLEYCEFYTCDEVSRKRYRAHRNEESGHERVALTDLQRIGGDIARQGEYLSTRSFYWRQYEVVRKLGDRPFLGYVLMLEMLARDCGPKILDKVSLVYGSRAASFLKIHAEEDESHVAQALKLLEDFSDSEKNRVVENFSESVRIYKEILNDCMRG